MRLEARSGTPLWERENEAACNATARARRNHSRSQSAVQIDGSGCRRRKARVCPDSCRNYSHCGSDPVGRAPNRFITERGSVRVHVGRPL